MIEAVARCLMALAACCLEGERRDWGAAMAAEFEEAVADGRPLGFATGCLLGAWRDLTVHQEGRLALATYSLAVFVILPAAALLVTGVAYGYPALDLAAGGTAVTLGERPIAFPRLNDGNVTAAPSLTLMVLGLAIGQLVLAWSMVERDWARVGIVGRLSAALLATLLLFAGLVLPGDWRLIVPASGLLVEALLVAVLAGWCARLHLRSVVLDAP